MLSVIELIFDAKCTPTNGNISFIIIITLLSIFKLTLLRELQGNPVYLESGTEKTERPQQGACSPTRPSTNPCFS